MTLVVLPCDIGFDGSAVMPDRAWLEVGLEEVKPATYEDASSLTLFEVNLDINSVYQFLFFTLIV